MDLQNTSLWFGGWGGVLGLVLMFSKGEISTMQSQLQSCAAVMRELWWDWNPDPENIIHEWQFMHFPNLDISYSSNGVFTCVNMHDKLCTATVAWSPTYRTLDDAILAGADSTQTRSIKNGQKGRTSNCSDIHLEYCQTSSWNEDCQSSDRAWLVNCPCEAQSASCP